MALEVDPPDLIPQPGAVFAEDGFSPNGLNPNGDVVYEDWPRLPMSEAHNFVAVEPCLLMKAGSTEGVFRVWGEPAWDIGRYWSEQPAQTADQFYGGLAVEYQWNSGLYQAVLLQANPIQSDPDKAFIKVWKGQTARQPAAYLDATGHYVKMADQYILPGGDIQYYIPYEYFTSLSSQRTPWSPLPASQQAVALAPVRITPLAAQDLPPNLEEATYRKLLEALGRLATLLRQIETTVSLSSPLLGAKEGFLSRSADLLLQSAEQLNRHLPSAATNADSRAQVTLTLWSLVATGRHVDGVFSFSGQQDAVNQAITDVVTAAHTLAKGTTQQSLEP